MIKWKWTSLSSVWLCDPMDYTVTGVTGKFGLGVHNEAGQRLIEFCQKNALVIAYTHLQHHQWRLYTWTSPDIQHRNQIDYILFSHRWRSSIQASLILKTCALVNFASSRCLWWNYEIWMKGHWQSMRRFNARSKLDILLNTFFLENVMSFYSKRND